MEEVRALKTGYLRCVGGASGDMILGAIIDAGVPIDQLNKALAGLNVPGISLSSRSDIRGGVRGTTVSVTLAKEAR